MKTFHGIICVLALAAGLRAQQPSATGIQAMNDVATSARLQLEKGIAQLNEVREQVAQEKLPLAQDLTVSEEKLAELRREYEKVSKTVASGNLEIPTLNAAIKARQDELSYVGNLLDEYARTFESKVNVSELQYCGEAIEATKRATEDPTLTADERFGRQVEFANMSIKRLFDIIGGMRFPGVGVDLQGMVVNGQFAIIGPVALFRPQTGEAGLVVQQSGSSKPLIRPLEGPMQAGLGPLIENGQGILPLDPSRGGALKELVKKFNLILTFEKGGPIMWPLLVCSILALGTVIERVFFLLATQRRRDPKAMEAFFEAVEKGDTDAAIRVSRETKFHVVRALGYALAHKETSLPNALLYAQGEELKRFRRGIPILDTVITLAPLLGLLGTVTGMMGSFSLIGGDLSAPGAITGGIAEALIATAFGLGIAITSLIPFNILNTRADEARAEIESAATQLELLVHPQAGSVQANTRNPGARAPALAGKA